MSANAVSVAVKTTIFVLANKAYRVAVAADGDNVAGEVSAVVGKRVVRLIPVSIEFAASAGVVDVSGHNARV